MTVDFAVRTEVEVVADAVMSLVRAGLVPKGRIVEAAGAVGVGVGDLRDADIRWATHHYDKPKRRPAREGGVPTSMPTRERQAPVEVPSQLARPLTVPKTRFCTSCHEERPLVLFSGDLVTCDSCRQRQREATDTRREREEAKAKAQRRLMAGVTERVSVRVSADGLGLDLVCARCGKPFEPGQAVCGELYHESCPA